MIKGIAHAAYHVSDMQKAVDFYCNKLGLKEAFNTKDEQGVIRMQYISIPGTMQFIELFPQKPDTKPSEGTYYSHLCLEVDDAVKTCAELEAKGVEMFIPIKQGGDGNWQFWTRDPDGNRIEFMQISSDSMQVKAIRSIL